MKIVLNKCYGGFGLSKEAYDYLGIPWDGYGYAYNDYELRTNPKLVECIETLGSEKASGQFSKLRVVEFPDDLDYEIESYDGVETVEEVHRSW